MAAEIGRLIKRLCEYFERKPPSDATMDLWLEEIGHIPGEAMPAVETDLRSLESWPRNFPKVVRNAWFAWLKANPKKRAREEDEKNGCQACRDGWLLSWKYVDDGAYLHTALWRCGQCGAHSKFQGIPPATRDDLMADGWNVLRKGELMPPRPPAAEPWVSKPWKSRLIESDTGRPEVEVSGVAAISTADLPF